MNDLNKNLIDAWEAKAQREWNILQAAGTGLVRAHALFEANIDLEYYRQWFQFWVSMLQLDMQRSVV